MNQQPFAIIAGVGEGTGAAVVRKFAKKYPVALLARSSKVSDDLVSQIQAEGGVAASFQVDISNETSVQEGFDKIRQKFGSRCAAAIFNASGRPFPKPFSWQSQDFLVSHLEISLLGAFLFAQASLPLLLAAKGGDFTPTLIFTGATAAVKANAWMQPFAVAKHALRAFSQNLAEEFETQGVHVSHVIVDGVIRMPLTWWFKPLSSWHAKLNPDAIADTYWYLHEQPGPSMTHEVSIRPFCENW